MKPVCLITETVSMTINQIKLTNYKEDLAVVHLLFKYCKKYGSV